MLDHAVAGGQPFGISPSDNVVKECFEEASIPPALAQRAAPTGAVSYVCLDEQVIFHFISSFSPLFSFMFSRFLFCL
jgi:hypothetical protein